MRRKGFTLIELLAVIVILAIIALIAVPLILNIIEKAKKGAFEDSAYGIINSARMTYVKNLEKPEFGAIEFDYIEGVEYPSIEGFQLEYSGIRPDNGKIEINENGEIAISISNNVYCAEKDFSETRVRISNAIDGSCEEGDNVKPPNQPDPAEPDKSMWFSDGSGASIPDVKGDMIPIKWNGDEWVKANLETEWYNYEDKRWANVVLVREEVREDYKSANEGFVIQEEDVLAYLVWIPRYKYELFNVEGESIEPITINIDFESNNTPKSVGAEDGQYLTHPAFTVGNSELNGIWVGKFETTGTATVPTIKPGITSLRSQNIYNQFLTSQRFNVTSLYGYIGNSEARMMNNFEWGAVTYLSYSDYGKNEEVWMNPSGSYITGCAGSAPTSGESPGCNNHYNSLNGQEASATGNVYGIYDLAGGAWEFVLAGMYNSSTTGMVLSSSGFSQDALNNYSISKYVNKYDYGTNATNYDRGVLGDATAETRGWFGDYQTFVNSSNPWFTRGGRAANGSSAGQFGFYYHLGNPVADRSFRVVLSSQ